MLSYAIVLLTAAVTFLGTSLVTAHPASPLAIAVVTQQFNNSGIVPNVIPAFKPIGLASLNYSTTLGVATVGQAIPKEQTSIRPDIRIRGSADAEATAGGPFNVTTIKYTAILFDGNYPGSANPNGYNLHYLENDLTYGVNEDHTVTLNNSTKGPVIAYAGPAPPAGSGPHRYILLVYPQPDNFTVPAKPAKGGGVALFNLTEYKAVSNLGSAIAGTYFTVEEGTASVSVQATQSVDSTTLPQYTPTSAGASPSGSAQPNGAHRGSVVVRAGVGGVVLAVLALISI